MANNFTNEGEVQLLSYVLKGVTLKSTGFGSGTAFTPSDTGGANQGIYISIHTADPTEEGVLSGEVSTTNTGYSRKAVPFKAGTESSDTGTGVGTALVSNGAISWTVGSADWNGSSNVTHFGLHFGSGASNTMFMYGPLTTPKPATSGDTVTIADEGISVTLL